MKFTAGKIGGGGGGGGIGKRPILYIGSNELSELVENKAAAAAACCCNNDDDIFELLIVEGGVDDDGVGGLSGVGERERRDIGDRERDLDEPDGAAFDDDDDDDDDEGDLLIDAFVLRGGTDDVDDVARPAFAKSGRGAGK